MTRLLAAVLFMSCATTATTGEKPGSRGLRASEHLDAAQREDQLAREHEVHPERRPDATGSPALWTRSWDPATDHHRLAQIHRGAAAQLHAEYDEACRSVPPDRISTSPLARHAIGGTATPDGATIYLAPDAGPADVLLRDMRCHRAWMMLAPSAMDSCPLDVEGIQVTAKGDGAGIAVTITVRDRALVDELQRRAMVEVETAAQRMRRPAD
jgi:hypothetical protein